MKLSVLRPSDNLKDIVKHYVVIEALHADEKLWILPNAGNFILFNPKLKAHLHRYDAEEEPFALPEDASVSIKANNIVHLSTADEESIKFPLLGVELLPTGCNRLFADNDTDLRNVYQLFENCVQNKGVSFCKLYQYDTLGEQINYIEKGLMELKEKASPVNEVCLNIEKVIDYIGETLHRVNVSDILTEFDYSRTSLERDFKKITGYTPKEFIQIMRFGVIVKDLMLNGYNFMKLEYDFFDQSHMNKAFKKFIDVSPSKLQAYVKENNIQIYQLVQTDA